MFAKSVIDCDLFIDMPQSARLLYYDLSMRADDDGFITPQKIIRMTGASKDDLSILIAKKFVIPFDSGVVVIRHWRINNYLRNDRYTETSYTEEKAQLTLGNTKEYELRYTNGTPKDIPSVAAGKVRLGKDRLGYIQKENYIKEKVDDVEVKEVPTSKRFVKPTLSEAQAYADEKGYSFSVEQWFSYYESNGWKVGKNPMKSWKASMSYWNTNNGSSNGRQQARQQEEVDHGYNPLVDRIDNYEEGNPWQ